MNADGYPNDARIVARLSHPNIVPVYDVGHAEDGRCYIVSKYIEGDDLAAALKKSKPSFSRAAELIAAICDALFYAHSRDIFHRDVKPANILIDSTGTPFLADFGLAMKDEDFGTGPHHLGTLAFMSPEQARGEGHLVDGRSDIFSLGIVLYTMLTGRRPFRGATRPQITHQVINSEPRPPRQIDSKIPKELERICLKAIAKRVRERYATAQDMADDLREFLKVTVAAQPSPDLSQAAAFAPTATGSAESAATSRAEPSDSSHHPLKIVPKGLCSFDEHDADFFLELLPGPRDRFGLPDSLRFWKTRILATDPERTFRVGLIYGPSGCGKSSLIKAGLLPQLKEAGVRSVYIESTANDTEAHLARALRHEIGGLAADAGLVRMLALLRQKASQEATPKVILILDQFEQWLFARGHEQETELVTALRQCDGEHIQALTLVRDDFWMAATRLMRDLDVELVPSQNVAAVDLFDIKHTRKVLAAYGRAYETLPTGDRAHTKEQSAFLEKAVAGLAQDGRVVPVRLAIFAEMVKNKPWTNATLDEVGGMEGVGVKFLDDNLSSRRANPVHKSHEKAAKAVLQSLLPETNADIKGRMRSVTELQEVSGYAGRPSEFAELLQVLDRNLRLITPVDVEHSIDDDVPNLRATVRYYQLTHDYLVHSVRDWLNKEMNKHPSGRAELLLKERSGLWNVKPENRYLPSLREWTIICLLARTNTWTEAQRRVMRRAGRVHGVRLVALCAVLSLVLAGVLGYNGYSITRNLLNSLADANVDKIPNVLNQLSGYPRWLYLRRLHELAHRADNDDRSRLGYSLALLTEPDEIEYLYRRLLWAGPAEMALIRDRVFVPRHDLNPRLWSDLASAKPDGSSVLPLAGVLARCDPASPSWDDVGDKVAGALVKCNVDDARAWREAISPIGDALTDPVAKIFREKGRSEIERLLAIELLIQYAADKPSFLVDLLVDADPKSFSVIFSGLRRDDPTVLRELWKAIRSEPATPPAVQVRGENEWRTPQQIEAELAERAKDEHASRSARAAVALVRFGYASDVWQLLEYQPDPGRRSAFVHALSTLGVDWSVLVSELVRLGNGREPPSPSSKITREKNGYLFDPVTSKRRALIMALAGCPNESLAKTEKNVLVEQLLELHENDRDAGVRSAAELALKRFGCAARLKNLAIAAPRRRCESTALVRQQRGTDDGADRRTSRVRYGLTGVGPGTASRGSAPPANHPSPLLHSFKGGLGRRVSEIRAGRKEVAPCLRRQILAEPGGSTGRRELFRLRRIL